MSESVKPHPKLYNGVIPDTFRDYAYFGNKRNDAVIRYALASPERVVVGEFPLNVSNICRITGQKDTRIYMAISEMIEYGLLEVTDPTYERNVKGRKYKAMGGLLHAAMIIAHNGLDKQKS